MHRNVIFDNMYVLSWNFNVKSSIIILKIPPTIFWAKFLNCCH